MTSKKFSTVTVLLPGTFWHKAAQVWQRLVDPLRPTETAVAHAQGRMLASIHLFLFLTLITFSPFIYTISQPQNRPFLLSAIILLSILLLAGYGLSRYLYLRGQLTLLTPLLTTFLWSTGVLVFKGGVIFPYLLGYSLVSVLLSSMFLPQRTTFILAITNLALLLALTLTQTQMTIATILSGPVALFTFLSGLMMLAHSYQQKLESYRQQELAKRERELSFFIEEANDWIFMLNPDGLLTYANQRMCNESGYSTDDLIGQPPTAFLAEAEAEAVAAPIAEILKGNSVEHVEVEVPLRDGRKRWFDVKGLIRRLDGEITGTYHIARDITDLKNAQAQLKKQNAEIGQLYAKAQAEITERQRAEEAERTQRLFAEALVETVNALHSTHHLPDVLHRLATAVSRALSPDGIVILLVKDAGEAYLAYSYGKHGQKRPAEANNKFVIAETPNLTNMTRTQRPHLIRDTRQDPNWIVIPEGSWIRSYVGAPIIAEKTTIGFLSMESAYPNVFTEEDAQKLMIFARQVATAIQNTRMIGELARYNDQLTQAVAARTAELAHSNQQMTAILENSPDAMALLNESGNVTVYNPAFARLLPAAARDTAVTDDDGLALVELFTNRGQAQEITKAFEQVLRNGCTTRLQTTLSSTKGDVIDLDIVLAPIQENGSVREAVCSLRDISNLKEVSRLKDEFIANISHELRTPITNIRLHHDLIIRNPARQDIYLDRLDREIDRLIYIIENLLRLSRLDRKHIALNLEPTDIARLVQQFFRDRQKLVSEKQIELSVACPATAMPIQVDPELISQVFGILLTNATNFTPTGGRIHVAMEQTVVDGRQTIRITMCNSGPNIPSNERPFIFDRFYRGSSAQDSGIPGTGLGLAIAREIMALHGGDVEIGEDRPDMGPCFHVWLPQSA